MAGDEPTIGMSPGVLAVSQMERLFENGAISFKDKRPDIDASGFDLRVGTTAWRVKHGQRPATRELARLKTESEPVFPKSDSNGDFFCFNKNEVYLIELDHFLKLPANINGRATGKSSIGRLDVITRLLTDNSSEYDTVEAGYTGPLHLLIQPKTFSVKVPPGASLNQLRLFSGPPGASIITRSLIRSFDTPFWYVPYPGRSPDYKCWEELVAEYNRSMIVDPIVFDLTVELDDPDSTFIYRAKKLTDPEPIDLRKGKASHRPEDYFEKVGIEVDGATRRVDLEENRFYIMKSKERLFIPIDVAVEVVAISERIGDIRIHYAGFAHSGFGRYREPKSQEVLSTKRGTPLIFEVRATDMATRLYDGSLLARIQLFRMSALTKWKSSLYDVQELNLSSYFKDWSEDINDDTNPDGHSD
ncbi:MAG: 2'-deoxycytidine 5'-triphosphate deaminase domain-containing protein [Blastocatellia bacterium]